MANLGGYDITVTSETPSYSVDVPEKPTEKGFSITDHVEKQPTILKITGLILGPDAGTIRGKLIAAMQAGDLLEYDGRNSFYNAALLDFDSDHDYKVANGMRFSATLREITVTKPPYEEAEPVLKTQIKPVTDQGTQQTTDPPEQRFHEIRAGESFYSIAPKYGTTWQAVAALNPGVDPKTLQVGQKVRVT